MMPVAENSQHQDPIDYKKKYKALKRKLKFLLYEHECFIEELRKAQRKLLRVSRDKSFLLDRLVQYERVDDSSDESDATASSDSETDTTREPGNIPKKKKHPQLGMFGDPTTLLSTMGFPSVAQTQAQGLVPSMIPTSFLGANFAASLPTANPGLPLGVSAAGVPLASMLTSAVVGRSPVLGVGASGVSSGKVDPAPLSTVLQHLAAITTTTGAVPGHVKSSPSASEPPKKKAKSSKKSSKAAAPSTAASSSTAAAGTAAAAAVAAAKLARPTSLPQRIITSSVTLGGHMTREELERHLEFKQSTKPQFMSIEKAPNMLPEDIFSNENSNPDSDFDPSQETGDDSDLVIDMPQD